MADRIRIELTLNGARRSVAVEPQHTLLDALRDDLGLTGAKSCCLVGECGACTVIVDGRAVDSCLVLAVEVDGADVRTVEGLAPAGGGLSTLQQAFLDKGAVQCGYCIPGQLMAAQALLEHQPHPSDAEIEEGLAGNLCRCACYEQIFEAVRETAASGDAAEPVGTAG
jgi:carbon-monoxide dehydrogenase small subunit